MLQPHIFTPELTIIFIALSITKCLAKTSKQKKAINDLYSSTIFLFTTTTTRQGIPVAKVLFVCGGGGHSTYSDIY